MYTEALGRAPDPSGWQSAADSFSANGCNLAALQNWGRGVYLSPEYSQLGYDNAARALTLYRGVLNREPDADGFANSLAYLNWGGSWAALVDAAFGSDEFANLSSAICGGGSYGFGGAAVIDLPLTGGGFAGSGGQLQAVLDATPPGGTVWLAQKAVVRLTTGLSVPPGVTLATTGAPDPYHYAAMGRLVRDANFAGPAVTLNSGAALQGVWVDGARGRLGYNPHDGINVRLLGGAGTAARGCVISNTAGWSSLQAWGSGEGFPCTGQDAIDGNLVTAYSSSHLDGTWADGLSVASEDTDVSGNQVVDATDAGIVLFRSTPAAQRSHVYGNTVVSAGNSAWAALAADPLYGPDPPGVAQVHDFSGSFLAYNALWTSPTTDFAIGLAVGTRAWFGDRQGIVSDFGWGLQFVGNTTGPLSARVTTGIASSGAWNARVQENVLTVILVRTSGCPLVNVGASVSAGWATGDFQPYTDVRISGCI
jgi:hypothetical protein